jgi:hypothetical protein
VVNKFCFSLSITPICSISGGGYKGAKRLPEEVLAAPMSSDKLEHMEITMRTFHGGEEINNKQDYMQDVGDIENLPSQIVGRSCSRCLQWETHKTAGKVNFLNELR